MFCPDGQYNVVAAIWFQTPEAIVRSLFHDEPGIYIISFFDATGSIITAWRGPVGMTRCSRSSLDWIVLHLLFPAFVLDVRSEHPQRDFHSGSALRSCLGTTSRHQSLLDEQRRCQFPHSFIPSLCFYIWPYQTSYQWCQWWWDNGYSNEFIRIYLTKKKRFQDFHTLHSFCVV